MSTRGKVCAVATIGRALAGSARWAVAVAAALVALAAPVAQAQSPAAREVTIYTTREVAFVEPLLRVFQELTKIKVNLTFVRDGLAEKVTAEGAASKVDLILAAEFSQLLGAKEAGITQPVAIKALTERIPASYRDADGHWFGLTRRARVVFAHKDRVKLDSITYEDLADPKWKGRICTRSGQHPYNRGLVASLIVHKGEAWTEQWLRGLKSNLAAKPVGGDRDQIAGVHAGKCDIALANTYYLGAMLANESQRQSAASVKLVFPNAGNRGTHVSISGMAMARHAPNAKNAALLMDFLVSEPAQFIYAQDNFEYPIREDVPASEMVTKWGPLKPDFVPLTIVANSVKKAAALIDKVAFDTGPGS